MPSPRGTELWGFGQQILGLLGSISNIKRDWSPPRLSPPEGLSHPRSEGA